MDAPTKHLAALHNWADGKNMKHKYKEGKKGGKREIKKGNNRERERERETSRGAESTSERISFPGGKRGERGMLSGTSATSHTRSLKDASR